MNVLLRAIAGVLALIAVSHSGGAQTTAPATMAQCMPRDEAVRQPDFFAFRAQLQAGVARRDLEAVLNVTSPEIRSSLGPDDGFDTFKRRLASRESDLWGELAAVLALGGTFEARDTFVAPYSFSCGDSGDVVVVGSDVRVRAAPSIDAPVLTAVSFSILRGTPGAGSDWAEVELSQGQKGYIAGEYVRSPIGYRAFFVKAAGAWRLTVFLAGD